MNAETFELRDALFSAIHNRTGVEQALGHVTDVSTDYDMRQMLSKVRREGGRRTAGALQLPFDRSGDHAE